MSEVNTAPAAETTATAPEATTTPVAETPKVEPKTLKLKINGQEVEEPEEEVVKYAQLGKQATTKFQEAAQMKREAEAILTKFEKDPEAALKELKGKNPQLRQAMEKVLWEAIQEDNKTPEQRQKEAMERELQAYKEKEKQTQEQAAKTEHEQQVARAAQEYDKQFVQALETSGLPKTQGSVARIANQMLIAMEAGVELSPAEAAEMVKQDYLNDIKALLGSLDDQRLLSLLGDDVASKLRKADLARVKGAPTQSAPKTQPTSTQSTQSDQSKKRLSSDEFKEEVRRRIEAL